jgi:3-phenylpropionate/trans-cinnamate dioxygenase ferredoxin reductase subunit
MVECPSGAVVIVGAGQAGARCAEALRALGHAGPVTLIGDEPEEPYERPPLSKSLLAGKTAADDARVLSRGWYEAHAVELRLGDAVRSIDRQARLVHLTSGQQCAYDALVLATGARPRQLGQGTLTLRSAADAARLRDRLRPASRLLIVGAGFIGLEVAATAHALGVQVTLVEAAATPMARAVPAAVGQRFVRLHASHGVAWRLGTRIAALECDCVTLADGEKLEAHTVLAAIGVQPNDELARQAGIACDDGVLVDAFGRTSDPSIFAIGDCARLAHPLCDRPIRLEAWQHAEAHAQAAARSIVGQPEPYAEVPWAWSDQYDVNLQVCGWPASGLRDVWRGDPDAEATLFQLEALPDGRWALRAAVSINRPRDQRAARRLIAAGTPVDPAALADPAARLG